MKFYKYNTKYKKPNISHSEYAKYKLIFSIVFIKFHLNLTFNLIHLNLEMYFLKIKLQEKGEKIMQYLTNTYEYTKTL